MDGHLCCRAHFEAGIFLRSEAARIYAKCDRELDGAVRHIFLRSLVGLQFSGVENVEPMVEQSEVDRLRLGIQLFCDRPVMEAVCW